METRNALPGVCIWFFSLEVSHHAICIAADKSITRPTDTGREWHGRIANVTEKHYVSIYIYGSVEKKIVNPSEKILNRYLVGFSVKGTS